jgi:hypothetical protein
MPDVAAPGGARGAGSVEAACDLGNPASLERGSRVSVRGSIPDAAGLASPRHPLTPEVRR